MNDITRLEPQKEVVANYQVNWDPFRILDEWKKLCETPEFGGAVRSLAQCDANALRGRKISGSNFEGRFFRDDVALQAFFLSYSEVIYEAKRVIDALGGIAESDLIDFPDLLSQRSSESESYLNNIVSVLYWFQRLIQIYEAQGFQPRDRFVEFDRVGSDRRDILAKIGREMRNFGAFNIQFYQGGGYGTMDFFFDMNTSETRVFMKDFVMERSSGYTWFSEYLDAQNPFVSLEKLNFLYPMGYRGYTFPLMNVVEIQLLMRDNTERIYRHGVQVVDGIENKTKTRVQQTIK